MACPYSRACHFQKFTLVESIVFDCGIVLLHYESNRVWQLSCSRSSIRGWMLIISLQMQVQVGVDKTKRQDGDINHTRCRYYLMSYQWDTKSSYNIKCKSGLVRSAQYGLYSIFERMVQSKSSRFNRCFIRYRRRDQCGIISGQSQTKKGSLRKPSWGIELV